MNKMIKFFILVNSLVIAFLFAEVGEHGVIEDYLGDEMLKSFDEPLYVKGGNGLDRQSVRLTILRSNENPVMLIWYPKDEKYKNSKLCVKKLKEFKPDNRNNPTTYTLILNKTLKIDDAVSDNLKQVFQKLSKLDDLELVDWKSEELDGSVWIYEFSGRKEGITIIRKSPFDFAPEEISEISKERIIQENRLTSFGLMLWTLSQNGEANLY